MHQPELQDQRWYATMHVPQQAQLLAAKLTTGLTRNRHTYSHELAAAEEEVLPAAHSTGSKTTCQPWRWHPAIGRVLTRTHAQDLLATAAVDDVS